MSLCSWSSLSWLCKPGKATLGFTTHSFSTTTLITCYSNFNLLKCAHLSAFFFLPNGKYQVWKVGSLWLGQFHQQWAVSSSVMVNGDGNVLKPLVVYRMCCYLESGWKWQINLLFLSFSCQFFESVQLFCCYSFYCEVKLVHLMGESYCRKNLCHRVWGKVVLWFWNLPRLQENKREKWEWGWCRG